MPYAPVEALEVRLWGRRIGAVALDPATRFYAFQYDPRFLSSGIEPAPIAMPLVRGAAPQVFTKLPEETYYRLPAMLADALPDRFGNALIDAWMARNGVTASSITPLDRLAYMGSRGMGALTFHPSRGPAKTKSTSIELAKLVEAARKTVHGELHADDMAGAALQQIIRVGTSAGGARAKAVIAYHPGTGEVRSGQFDVPPGFEHWLLKFDGIRPAYQDLGATETYGRIEYAYYLMAKEAGINMHACELLKENGRAHFMTKRFDRDAGGVRHHMQSLCAIASMDYKQVAAHSYHQFFDAMIALKLPRAALIEGLRRMVFNVLGANNDDHPKNFSFLWRAGGRGWELAPAYDMTHAYDPASQWVSRHLMSVNGKFDAITKADLRAVAERYDLLAQFTQLRLNIVGLLLRTQPAPQPHNRLTHPRPLIRRDRAHQRRAERQRNRIHDNPPYRPALDQP
jgi:serine/threonine-protein kinase HipA